MVSRKGLSVITALSYSGHGEGWSIGRYRALALLHVRNVFRLLSSSSTGSNGGILDFLKVRARQPLIGFPLVGGAFKCSPLNCLKPTAFSVGC